MFTSIEGGAGFPARGLMGIIVSPQLCLEQSPLRRSGSSGPFIVVIRVVIYLSLTCLPACLLRSRRALLPLGSAVTDPLAARVVRQQGTHSCPARGCLRVAPLRYPLRAATQWLAEEQAGRTLRPHSRR